MTIRQMIISSVASDFIKQIPEIIKQSGSLFGVLVVITLILGIFAYFFFVKSESKQKERVFVYMILAFLAIIFSAVIGANRQGAEGTISQIEQDKTVVDLPIEIVQEIDAYLESEGEVATPENRINFIKEATQLYVNPPELTSETPLTETKPAVQTSSPPSIPSTETGTTVEDFFFTTPACNRKSDNVTCRFFVINQDEEDRNLNLFADQNDGRKSTAIAPDGSQYPADFVTFGSNENAGYVSNRLVQNVKLEGSVVFKEIPTSFDKFDYLEIYADNRTLRELRAKHFDVQIN